MIINNGRRTHMGHLLHATINSLVFKTTIQAGACSAESVFLYEIC